ncbi:helix-turn-helix transcriptional regulator [Streptomyces lonarensis]|uniref:AAA family ATPase n=1 Tax=Streptomyces lonarensis TaxID=700599 RepID=A0A7X6CX43_9ACTN|nr:helix-turn-helix transcriptional regulator [Streptomyces lonarensis]NJQ04202.1 AAA family ATPase [Streptomyces lonarensis]
MTSSTKPDVPGSCTPGCPPGAHGEPATPGEYRLAQRHIDEVHERLAAGAASVLTLGGRPGHAQNALLRRAACRAAAAGIEVLHGRASPAEGDLRYGVVQQLLGPGDASVAAALDAPARVADQRGLPGLSRLMHAVRRRPALLVVEDVQWLDDASRDWLRALLHRLRPRTPLAVLVSAGTGHVTAPGSGWDRDTAPRHGVLVRRAVVPALSDRGVATAVRDACGRSGDPEFVVALTAATAGNPAVLRDVLREFTSRGHRPVASELPVLHAVAAEVVGEHTVGALDGLPDEVTAVLRALAVCGDLLDLTRARSLAGGGMPEERLRALLDGVGLTLPVGDKVHIRFPASKARIIEDMPADRRADLHARAAASAHAAGVDDEDIAHLLLRSPPLGAPWVVPLLRRGSTAALRREDHDRACSLLGRALQEPLEAAVHGALTLELAAVEALAVPEAGERRLEELVRGATPEPQEPVGERPGGPQPGPMPAPTAGLRARAVDLGFARGNSDWVRRTVAEALPFCGPAERADLVSLFWLAASVREDREPTVPAVPPLPAHPGHAAQAATRAWQLATRGHDAATTRRLARRALSRTGPDTLLMPRLAACGALVATDDQLDAVDALDALLADARRGNLRSIAARVLTVRANLHLRAARLTDAERDLDGAERALPAAHWHPMALPDLLATRILLHLETGRPDRARRYADTTVPPGGEDGVWWSSLLCARARVAAEDGDMQGALRLARESGRLLLRRQWVNPAGVAWRAVAAEAAAALGDLDEARRLREQEIALADRWGTASGRGTARMWAARDPREAPADALLRLREATALLRHSPARLSYGWSLVRRARAEAAAGDASAAARSLHLVALVTSAGPGGRLAETARRLTPLAVPRAPGRTAAVTVRGAAAAPPAGGAEDAGWDDLTEAERDTLWLAARGSGNRQIAERLAVSRRTVELRLSNAYRKLGIDGRKELHRLPAFRGGPVADAS